MQFKELNHLENLSFFRQNLVSLAFNIYKIKYFYEEASLVDISRNISDPIQTRDICEKFQNAAEEADIYIKTLAAFLEGNASFPQDKKYFLYVLNYFFQKQSDLSQIEINEKDFQKWLNRSLFI